MQLINKTTELHGQPAVEVRLQADPDDEAVFALFAPSTRKVVRDLVGGTTVLVRDLCTPTGKTIALRKGEREIDLVHAICIELIHMADAIGIEAQRSTRRLCRRTYSNGAQH